MEKKKLREKKRAKGGEELANRLDLAAPTARTEGAK